MKLKEWIRTKLVQFLLIDDMWEHQLQENKRISNNIATVDNNTTSKFIALNKDINNLYKGYGVLENTLKNVVSVGADVTYDKNSSWAVVCIEGKCNVVKFFDLHGKYYDEMLRFLKQFESSRMCIDTPPTRMFKDAFKL